MRDKSKSLGIQITIIIIGIIASLTYYKTEKERMIAQNLKKFEFEFSMQYSELQENFKEKKLILNSIEKFFEASQNINLAEFKIFTEEIIENPVIETICWFNSQGESLIELEESSPCHSIDLLKEAQVIPSEVPLFALTSYVHSRDGERGVVTLISIPIDLASQKKNLISKEYLLLLNQSSNKFEGLNLKTKKFMPNIEPIHSSKQIFIQKKVIASADLRMYYFASKTKEDLSSSQARFLYTVTFLIALVFLIASFYTKVLYGQKAIVQEEVRKKTEDLREEVKQRKQAQLEAERYTELKGQFMANMSHEIRTPMNAILGMMELLSGTDLTAEQLDYLEAARTSGNSLMSLLNDILDFSKIESGKLELNEDQFSFTTALDEVIELFGADLQKKNITLKRIFNGADSLLMGDKRRIQQVAINLLSNAIKFTDEGVILIHLNNEPMATIDSNNGKIKITLSIKDNGIGISEENTNKLFQSFSQVDSSISREYGGTGLGLAISSHLIEMMGGKISVQSQLGVGTEFTVTLILGKATSANQAPALNSPATVKSNKEFWRDFPISILVVEDNDINQKLMKAFLKKLGYEITIASDGLEACQICESSHFDLVFMDLQMPIMGGIEATEKILESINRPPIIVAMTANAFEEDKRKSFEAGMKSFLTKPVRLRTLKDVIKEHFSS